MQISKKHWCLLKVHVKEIRRVKLLFKIHRYVYLRGSKQRGADHGRTDESWTSGSSVHCLQWLLAVQKRSVLELFFLLHFIVDGVKPSQNEIYSIKVWVIIVLHPLAFPSTWRQHVTIHKCGFPFDRYMTRSIRDYPLIVLDHLQSIAWSHAELHLWLLHSGGGQR